MKFYSTNNPHVKVDLERAVIRGLAPDNGLYMPERLEALPADFFRHIDGKSFQEISYHIASHLLGNEVPASRLKDMVEATVTFDAPLVEIEKGVHALELFHGPTLAFKDFGARFLSGLLGYFAQQQDREIIILAATSGDTGSAVANGFLGVKGTRVIVLYPKGKVSVIQEKQFTTLGSNITALEIDGTFDDCQRLVKEAFLDEALQQRLFLTSANSINIGRLIPQTFYYFWAYARSLRFGRPIVFSVPSGNYGNLTAGLISKRLGLHVRKFVAATNANDCVPMYLNTGLYRPAQSKATVSNAMDVGAPSNFARMMDLYHNDLEKIKEDVAGFSFSDDETIHAMKDVYTRTGYRMDPHGAIGYLGLRKYNSPDETSIFLETAHPGKFEEVVERAIGHTFELPERLRNFLSKEKRAVPMNNSFHSFKEYLLTLG